MKHVVSGSKVVVGLFDSLRQFTNQVGKLVNVVGDRLDDRRGGRGQDSWGCRLSGITIVITGPPPNNESAGS